MPAKTIPNNKIAEQSVLGSMFLSPFALQKACDDLMPESLYYDENKEIFSIFRDLHSRGIKLDSTTVISELKNKNLLNKVGGFDYLTEIFNIVPTAANIDNYIELVEQTALQRRLIEVSQNIESSAYDTSTDINEMLDEAERKILNVVQLRKILKNYLL